MSNLFSENDGIRYSRDFSGIEFCDVSKVTNMSCMFWKNSSFNQDISSWDVSNVTNMNYMFSESSFIQDISSWDVSNIKDMREMFSDSSNKSYKYLLRKNKSLLRKILPTLKSIFRNHE